GNDVRLAVTASTGIAAVNIGGSTLHSFAGVGLGKEDKEELRAKQELIYSDVYERWLRTEILIIDES
ncbi:hypothetical protein PHLGIDRAFT_43768, partial [Phlebiopsis gigantea 11061_1 CR5-6]